MNSAKPARLAARAGFTLLEVMCALAILAAMTGFITMACHQAIEQGGKAVDLRELREAADTVFRRLCYQDGNKEHPDGYTDSLGHFYATWAQLPTEKRKHWDKYVMEFSRKPKTVAGSNDDSSGAESLFGSSGSSSTGTKGTGTKTPGSTTGTGGTGGTGTGTDTQNTSGVTLMQLTLRIFLAEERDQPLIVLQTYLPSQVEESGSGSSAR